MKIKSILLIAAALSGTFAITGCDRVSDREIECLELTGDRLCRNEFEQQADASRRGVGRMNYGPAGPGEYHNYYGNPEYGDWGDDGRYHFRDPYGSHASQTNAFLLGAGMGGLAAYALTRNQFKQQNPNGWTDTKRTNKEYIGKDGKKISKAEFKKRKAQSEKDKAAHKAKKKSTAQLKQKQAKRNEAKSKVKPTAKQNNDLKAKLKAKQAKRKADKAAGKPTAGSKMKANEQKVQKQKPKQQKAQKKTYKQQKSSSKQRPAPKRSSSRKKK